MTDVDYLLAAVRRIAFRELTETVRVRADNNRLETENAQLRYQLGLLEGKSGWGVLKQSGGPFGSVREVAS